MDQLRKWVVYIGVVFACYLLTGCGAFHASPDRSAAPIVLNKALIISDRIVIDRISVNGTLPPTRAWDRAIDSFRKYVSGEVVINEVISVSFPTDENGYLTKDQPIHLDEVGPHQITFLFIPKMKRDVRGIYETSLSWGRKQVITQAIKCNADKIKRSAFLFISEEQVWEIVLLHELGHALGVPGNPSHTWDGSHCTSPSCVMYPRPDARSIFAFFFHGLSKDFCQECQKELLSAKREAKKVAAESVLDCLGLALHLFKLDNGRYPTTEERLAALLTKPKVIPELRNWKGPYIERPSFIDPWGNFFVYTSPGPDYKSYELRSYGRDGKEGGGDDIAETGEIK